MLCAFLVYLKHKIDERTNPVQTDQIQPQVIDTKKTHRKVHVKKAVIILQLAVDFLLYLSSYIFFDSSQIQPYELITSQVDAKIQELMVQNELLVLEKQDVVTEKENLQSMWEMEKASLMKENERKWWLDERKCWNKNTAE